VFVLEKQTIFSYQYNLTVFEDGMNSRANVNV